MNKQDRKAQKLKRCTGKYLGKHNLFNFSKTFRKQNSKIEKVSNRTTFEKTQFVKFQQYYDQTGQNSKSNRFTLHFVKT